VTLTGASPAQHQLLLLLLRAAASPTRPPPLVHGATTSLTTGMGMRVRRPAALPLRSRGNAPANCPLTAAAIPRPRSPHLPPLRAGAAARVAYSPLASSSANPRPLHRYLPRRRRLQPLRRGLTILHAPYLPRRLHPPLRQALRSASPRRRRPLPFITQASPARLRRLRKLARPSSDTPAATLAAARPLRQARLLPWPLASCSDLPSPQERPQSQEP